MHTIQTFLDPTISKPLFKVPTVRCRHLRPQPRVVKYVTGTDSTSTPSTPTCVRTSELSQAPPLDPETAFRCYDQTLRHVLDQHAPLITNRVSLRQSVECTYDSECRAMKRTTRRLECQYRRHRVLAHAVSVTEETVPSQVFILLAVSRFFSCRRNPRALWKTVNNTLQPPSQSATDKLSADDFAKFVVDKVAKIRASTAAAAAPVIIPRDVLPLTELEPTSVHEITKLLSTLPAESCCLDPMPTWLLKRISATVQYSLTCATCHFSAAFSPVS